MNKTFLVTKEYRIGGISISGFSEVMTEEAAIKMAIPLPRWYHKFFRCSAINFYRAN